MSIPAHGFFLFRQTLEREGGARRHPDVRHSAARWRLVWPHDHTPHRERSLIAGRHPALARGARVQATASAPAAPGNRQNLLLSKLIIFFKVYRSSIMCIFKEHIGRRHRFKMSMHTCAWVCFLGKRRQPGTKSMSKYARIAIYSTKFVSCHRSLLNALNFWKIY